MRAFQKTSRQMLAEQEAAKGADAPRALDRRAWIKRMAIVGGGMGIMGFLAGRVSAAGATELIFQDNYIQFKALTADPSPLPQGGLWWRDDLPRLVYSPDGVATRSLAHLGDIPTVPGFATPSIALGSAAAAGAASTVIRSDATLAAFDLTVPSTSSPGDAAAVGTAAFAARRDHLHARGDSYATPSIALGTAAAAGVSAALIRADATLAAFDTTVPVTQAMGDGAATGSIAFAARRDHKHGMPAFATNAILLGSAAAAGAATTPLRSNDTIAAFDATVPTTSALGDAATVGTIAFAARRDHLHGRESFGSNEANSVIGTTTGAGGSATTPARSDHSHGITAVVFSIGLLIDSPTAVDRFMWVAPFACTVTNVKGYQDVGTGTTINAFKGTLASPTLFLASNLSVTPADSSVDGGAVQNTAVAAGDKLYARIAALAGSPNRVAVRVFLTRP